MPLHNPPTLRTDGLLPTGAIGQSIPRYLNPTTAGAMASGVQRMTAVDLPAGALVSSFTYLATGTVADTITHCWAG